jgi:hypothetical protein
MDPLPPIPYHRGECMHRHHVGQGGCCLAGGSRPLAARTKRQLSVLVMAGEPA